MLKCIANAACLLELNVQDSKLLSQASQEYFQSKVSKENMHFQLNFYQTPSTHTLKIQ